TFASFQTSTALPAAPQTSTALPAASLAVPQVPPPAPYSVPPYAPPGLFPHPGDGPPPAAWSCGDKPPAPFTPFMLGDFVGPVATQFSDVKTAEGKTPRPLARVFYRFNYYNTLNKPRWAAPPEPIHNVTLFRQVFGLEKTFLDQRFSLGLRVP